MLQRSPPLGSCGHHRHAAASHQGISGGRQREAADPWTTQRFARLEKQSQLPLDVQGRGTLTWFAYLVQVRSIRDQPALDAIFKLYEWPQTFGGSILKSARQ
jgi:hypothetical protein